MASLLSTSSQEAILESESLSVRGTRRKRAVSDGESEQAAASCDLSSAGTDCGSLNENNPYHGSSLSDTSTNPSSPYHISTRVKMVMQKWGNVQPIAPQEFLIKILEARGHPTHSIPAMKSAFRRLPTGAELEDYTTELVGAVRQSNIQQLKQLQATGKSMSACNRFCESVVHMACRRAKSEVVEFMLRNGGSKWLVDDFGRTPLHDACWRPEPHFDIVTLLLDLDPDMLRVEDVRGSTPLKYVPEEHWIHWCAYLFHQKEKYWPKENASGPSSSPQSSVKNESHTTESQDTAMADPLVVQKQETSTEFALHNTATTISPGFSPSQRQATAS